MCFHVFNIYIYNAAMYHESYHHLVKPNEATDYNMQQSCAITIVFIVFILLL